jgi:protein-S-isoprenylcysteine O-methyltransferase Ste14
MSILGIGPLLALVGVGGAAVVMVLARYFGISIALPSPWREWGSVVGVILAAFGVVLWIGSGIRIKRAFGQHRLVTAGVFHHTRNPMYAAFIVFLLPACALFLNEMFFLLVPLLMYVAFKAAIGKEEQYLAEQFGEDYRQYRGTVNQLVPFFRIPRPRPSKAA